MIVFFYANLDAILSCPTLYVGHPNCVIYETEASTYTSSFAPAFYATFMHLDRSDWSSFCMQSVFIHVALFNCTFLQKSCFVCLIGYCSLRDLVVISCKRFQSVATHTVCNAVWFYWVFLGSLLLDK